MLFTIGHSNHDLPAFLDLLARHGVDAVADVRSQPASRLPQYDKGPLAESLRRAGIDYAFLGRELGARRDERECYEAGRVVYERVAELAAFRDGLARVLRELAARNVALLCAEKEPLDCHRTILVCRHLRGRTEIGHILADGSLEEHARTERRLVKATGVSRTLFEPDLTPEEILERAYAKRGREIAYRAEDAEESP